MTYSIDLSGRVALVTGASGGLGAQFARAPGNYLAFFSSFEYLGQALRAFRAALPQVPVWAQSASMTEAERSAFVDRFEAGGRGIAFAVLGGVFAEGIDLPGDRLIGAFIASLGLPQHDEANEVLRARMEALFGQGYAYTYLYPGRCTCSTTASTRPRCGRSCPPGGSSTRQAHPAPEAARPHSWAWLRASAANGATACTARPPTTVSRRMVFPICSTGTRRKSWLGTLKSASLPTSSEPRRPSSKLNQAASRVYMRKACSRVGISLATRSGVPLMVRPSNATQTRVRAARAANLAEGLGASPPSRHPAAYTCRHVLSDSVVLARHRGELRGRSRDAARLPAPHCRPFPGPAVRTLKLQLLPCC